MKVAMITRSTLFTVKGGDTVQVAETCRELKTIGIDVDIKLTNEKINYDEYDLLHFFNIIRPADILYHIKRSSKPYVVTPIHIDYSEYDKLYRKGFAGLLFRFLPADSIEYVKAFGRWILGKDKLMSLSYLLMGQRISIKKILKRASLLLPNSESEYKRISEKYKYFKPRVVVPNGIDTSLFQFETVSNKDDNMIICVARIEGIKNQLNLIKAMNDTKFKLFIIGSPAPNQLSYFEECRKTASSNVKFIGHLPQQELIQYYKQAKVHVLPSWFETTGLSSLEAAAMGCNVVITNRGDAKEYFVGDAFYCDPSSPVSILDAVKKASSKETNGALQRKIYSYFTWQQAALQTKKAYEQVMQTL